MPQREAEAGQQLISESSPSEAAAISTEELAEVDVEKSTVHYSADAQRSSRPDAIDEDLNACLGRYQLIGLIAKGGFGEVWRALDPDLQRQLAIKIPRRDKHWTEESASDFLEEARKVARLNAPGIVPVYDVGQESGRFFVVSKYMPGGTLRERMKRQKLTFVEAATLVAQVADNLHRVHLHGIVHRDIKPSNILLDEHGQAYVSDFGLAVTEHEQLSESSGIYGTICYMAPEQAGGKSHRADSRADIYSLGVILYQLLTARLPFVASNSSEYLDQILERDPRPPRTLDDSIPPALEQICLKCLRKSPLDRYSTAKDLANELRHWAASIEGPKPAQKESHAGRKLAFAVIALAVVVMASWKIAGALGPKQESDPGKADGQLIGGTVPDEPKAEPGEIIFQNLDADELEPFEKYDLLKVEPKTIVGPAGAGGGKHFDKASQSLSVMSREFGLFQLGEVERPHYTLRIDIKQPNQWSGQAGIYFGLDESGTGQMIVFQKNTDRDSREFPMLAVRYRVKIVKGQILQQFPSLTVPYTMKLAATYPGQPDQLEVKVHGTRLTQLRWGGQNLAALRDAKLDRCFSGEEYTGGFGIFSGHVSGVTFANAQVTVEEE